MLNQNYSKAGRRKTAIARVRTSEGEGRILINDKTLDDYFMGLDRHKKTVLKPLEIWDGSKGYDFYINVRGGGNSGQAGAIRHSLARALLTLNADLKPALKKEKLLTRDPRMVERKKPGKPKARKRFQFSKR